MVSEKPRLKSSLTFEEKMSYNTRENEAGLLLLDYVTDNIYEANDSGAVVVRLCDGSHTIDNIADKLLEEYDAERDRIMSDLKVLFTEMEKLGLFEE